MSVTRRAKTGREPGRGGRPSSASRSPLRSALLRGAAAVLATAGVALGGLTELEAEFENAVKTMDAATVFVVAGGLTDTGVSGVLISPKGLVLTSAAAGRGRKPGPPVDTVEVRVPDAKTGFRNFKGTIVERSAETGTAVLRIDDPPDGGFKAWIVPASSADLRVGSLGFVAGNSFGLSTESAPTLTAGIVAAAIRGGTGPLTPGGEPAPAAGPGTASASSPAALPPIESFYTTAAVNPGVQGGPFVDARGQLVGIVAGWVDVRGEEGSPLQFLGRIVPMDRVRAALGAKEAGRAAFAGTPPTPRKAEESSALETVFAHTAQTARKFVRSLTIDREKPVSSTAMVAPGKATELPRYRGPVSAVPVRADGIVVTSLYNVTNVSAFVNPALREVLPPDARPKEGLAAVKGATLHLADGTGVPATLLAVHEGLGIAVFRATLPAGTTLSVPDAAPAGEVAEGRFALVHADPFGAQPRPDPFLTVGIVSKRHAEEAAEAWRGQWQTDARGTDGNCGGLVTDLRGRAIGISTLWDVAGQGRSSGISYVVPWEKILAALPRLAEGESLRRPFLGVTWAQTGEARIESVLPGSAAATAGLQPGDLIVKFGEKDVADRNACMRAIAPHTSGDKIRIRVKRGSAGTPTDVDVVLGARD